MAKPLSAADASLFTALYTDAETMRFIGPPLSHERAARGFHRLLALMNEPAADQRVFTLVERESGEAVGICSLQHIEAHPDAPPTASLIARARRAEAGIIIDAAHRFQGFAKEGLQGLLRHAFQRLLIDEVWVRIAVDHTVVEKLVIGVGLFPDVRTTATGGPLATRIWSARRDSWVHAAGRL